MQYLVEIINLLAAAFHSAFKEILNPVLNIQCCQKDDGHGAGEDIAVIQ